MRVEHLLPLHEQRRNHDGDPGYRRRILDTSTAGTGSGKKSFQGRENSQYDTDTAATTTRPPTPENHLGAGKVLFIPPTATYARVTVAITIAVIQFEHDFVILVLAFRSGSRTRTRHVVRIYLDNVTSGRQRHHDQFTTTRVHFAFPRNQTTVAVVW